MTRDEVRAAAKRVTQWHERFAGLFGRRESQAHSLVYLKGLLSDQKRKSVEPIALRFARGRHGARATQKEVVAMQGFLSASPWEAADVFGEIQAVFAEEFVPSTRQWSIGTVGVIDESGFVKAGSESVGVAVQWCGRLGKTQNCQVGVFLTGVTPTGTALLDAQLFLSEEWIADRRRRQKTRVPRGVKFQSKPQIAAAMIRRTLAAGKVHFDWLTADALYGDSGEFMEALEEMKQRYLLEVRKTTLLWTVDPATLPGSTPGPKRRKKLGSYRYHEVRSVQEIAAGLAAESWHLLKLREGSKGPLVFEFAVVRGWAVRHNRPGPPIWVLIRRSLAKTPEVWYYLCNASADTPWEALAMVSGTRCRVEECFEDGKTHLGMADYETRSWESWHHHMSLVALAHLYVTLTRRDLKRDVPELTLDMALQLLRSAFARSQLTEEDAIELVEYHLRRNRTARKSHRKTWLQKHKRIKPEVLL
jgi:SRSO17 transposase